MIITHCILRVYWTNGLYMSWLHVLDRQPSIMY